MILSSAISASPSSKQKIALSHCFRRTVSHLQQSRYAITHFRHFQYLLAASSRAPPKRMVASTPLPPSITFHHRSHLHFIGTPVLTKQFPVPQELSSSITSANRRVKSALFLDLKVDCGAKCMTSLTWHIRRRYAQADTLKKGRKEPFTKTSTLSLSLSSFWLTTCVYTSP